MKKTVMAMFMAMVFLLLSSAAMAETVERYAVKEGDCLSVIGSKLKIKWKKIALDNKISKPYIIHPGQKLIIQQTVKEWKKVNRNPYKGTWQWAIENFSLPAEIKKQVMKNIENNNFQWIELESGQILNQMVFGQNQIQNKTLCSWSKTQLYAAKDYGYGNYHVIRVLMCGNWAWYKVNFKKKIAEFPPVPVFGSKEEAGFPPVPVFSPEQEEKTAFYSRFDAYMGGGAYESVHEDAKGWYVWGKARYRPLEFNLGDNLYARLGIFAFGAMGQGNDRNYNYDWRKWAIGPTAKLIGIHWDADLDAGIGKLYNKGGEGLYKSEQIDNIFLFSAHLNYYARRDAKKKWFSKTEFNFELTVPFSSSHEHAWNGQTLTPDAYHNRSIELFLTQSIYDIDLDNHLLLTPGFNFGIGHNYGLDQNFYQLGPCATLSWHNEDIVSVSFLNYKEMLNGDGDQWNWISGYLNISGVYMAYKSSQIKEATEKDLKI